MAKLTKFKAQQVEFGTHYKIEETNRGDTKIKSITPAFGNIREPGTPETEEIYNGLQLGNVHTLQANKTTNLNIDYYVCNLEGLTEFGVNNDLKLRINVDTKNTNTTTKLRLNNIDYTLLKEYNGTLKQIEAGDFKPNKSYELAYNGNQFIIINITEYGTESDTVLEGKRLAEIIGLEFGGNIQDTGAKVTGKFYFDNVTKFYYECIENTNLTYNESSKFRAISNKPLSDKVENLYNVESHTIDSRLTVGIIHKIGNVCILTLDSNELYDGRNYGEVLFNIPEKFRPKFLTPVSVGIINSASGGAAHIETNGNVVWRGGSRTSSALYINAIYLAK
ncbi:hypothetical protein [Leptotrichia massiliensis]